MTQQLHHLSRTLRPICYCIYPKVTNDQIFETIFKIIYDKCSEKCVMINGGLSEKKIHFSNRF